MTIQQYRLAAERPLRRAGAAPPACRERGELELVRDNVQPSGIWICLDLLI